MKQILFFLLIFTTLSVTSQQNRWELTDNNAISWKVKDSLPHYDHIEMSGKYISAVIRYGVNDDKSFRINRDIVWPMLRTIPNNTHGSLIRSSKFDPVDLISVNGLLVQKEIVNEIFLDGKITVKSTLDGKLELVRILFPSTDLPVFCEKYELRNIGQKALTIEIPQVDILTTSKPEDGVDGAYRFNIKSQNHGTVVLQPNESSSFYLYFSGTKMGEGFSGIDVETELAKRESLLSLFSENLILETPDETINRAFAFAKIRAAESIFQTKGGPMHGPGGLRYYAAIWANDQAEYINPFFPYLGYDYGIESALNSYRHFARFMNKDFHPLPSSIIAEGTDIWNGAGDRGDAAMIAYGAARFALSQGDSKIAQELWPLIEWCLEFNKRKLNADGVVNSDTDELEGRFPSGNANLCTSSLYYDALVSAFYLGRSLGKSRTRLSEYQTEATTLKANIDKYFGANLMGYETYQYYEGNKKLRAWICIPLTVDIFDRKEGTIDALFSPELWTPDGLASESGDLTFWDRSTLYALRGVFAAGDTRRGLKYLQYYSTRRLLGEHVPYPVEAYPEGNQRHLSAESGLYCRIFTEGLFGIRPLSLTSFSLCPQLPDDWDFMKLRNVHGFQKEFDINVQREGDKIRLKVTSGKEDVFNELVENGSRHEIKM